MNTPCRALLFALLLSTQVQADPVTNGGTEAYSRIYRHKDGTRTESYKNGDKNEIEEFTYDQANILNNRRLFVTDSKGRCRQGYIFDGQKNPLGSVQFGYHKVTDQLVEERQFNKKGQLVRRLFYPGALKETVSGKEYGNRFVAFNYDPNDPNAKPVQSKEVVKPTKPVESDQDDFDPQIPTGRVAPPANATPPSSSATPAPAPAAGATGRRRSFFGGGGTGPATPAVPAPPSAPAPAPRVLPNPPAAVPPAAVPAAPAASKKAVLPRRPQT